MNRRWLRLRLAARDGGVPSGVTTTPSLSPAAVLDHMRKFVERGRRAQAAVNELGAGPRRCRVCGCTDADCSPCIARTGAPCWWVAADLCSACEP